MSRLEKYLLSVSEKLTILAEKQGCDVTVLLKEIDATIALIPRKTKPKGRRSYQDKYEPWFQLLKENKSIVKTARHFKIKPGVISDLLRVSSNPLIREAKECLKEGRKSEGHWKAKLSLEDVKKMFVLRMEGQRIKDIGIRFPQVTEKTIGNILLGRSWVTPETVVLREKLNRCKVDNRFSRRAEIARTGDVKFKKI